MEAEVHERIGGVIYCAVMDIENDAAKIKDGNKRYIRRGNQYAEKNIPFFQMPRLAEQRVVENR